MQALNDLARKRGCYKIILNCELFCNSERLLIVCCSGSDKNVPFYEKLTYTKHGNELALYFDKEKEPEA